MQVPVNTIPKFQTKPLTQQQKNLMEQTMNACKGKDFKPVRCPHCDYIVGYAPKNEDNFNYYVCRKCKAQMLLNGRLFKTSRNHMNRKIYLKRKYNLDID